ncbi:MAG: gliding motility-associated C-terminal domain-containing protein [Bacteroidia bacterium]|nr:gliding motility-associated C-terminal domain-containing protein [Bacteroidia bacterium]
MNKFKKILFLFLAGLSVLNAQTQMAIGPQSASFTGMVRGYHFTSPVAFNICALYIPPDAPGAAGQNQHIRVVRFTAGNPPAFPGVTNGFVQLFSITNAGPTATVPCNIPVAAGDIIGIYGARAGNCINSYDGVAFNTTILGQPTTLRRSGMQACISAGQNMANIWSEINFSIGRIFMYYNCCPTPTITTAASATNICAGANVTILGGGANTYTWMPGNITTTNITTTPTVTTTYTLNGDINGCIGSNTVMVQVNNYPTYTVTPATSTICQNGTVNASASMTNAAAHAFTWSPGPGIATPNAQNTAISPPPITGSVATNIYSVVVTPTAAYCPVQQTLAITIVNPLTPTLTQVNPICTNAPAFSLQANPPGGSWSGSSAVTMAGLFNPAIAAIGINTVMYSLNVNNCVVTNTMAIDVTQFNSANITGTLGTQCQSFPATNLLGLVQSTVNGTWSGTGVTNNVFSPTGLQTGAYTLTYNTASSPNATLCPDSQTLVVNVLNPQTSTLIADPAYCTNLASVQLTATPNTGNWVPSQYLSVNGVFTPPTATVGANIVQYVVGTATCNVTQSIVINVEQFVPAVITTTAGDKCATDPIMSLAGFATNQVGTWSGPGVSGAQFDPAIAGAGNHILTYNTNSMPTASLCPATATLAVNVFSLAPPVVAPAGPFCNTFPPVQLIASPLGGIFFSYNSPAVDYNGVFSPAGAPIGGSIIHYTIANGPCYAVTTITVNVERFVQANLVKYPGPYCKNDPPVSLFGFAQYLGGTFTGPGVINGIFTPSLANVGDNNIITHLTHSIPTESLCPDTASVRIKINDVPNLTLQAGIYEGCEPLQVTLNCPEVNSGTGNWSFGDGNYGTGYSTSHTYTNAGNYDVHFTYTDEIGCKAYATLPSTITVFERPLASFVFDPNDKITLINPTVYFTNQTTQLAYNQYEWKIGNMYSLKDIHPKVIFYEPGEYNIHLTATSFHGCVDEFSQTITVKNDFGVYVPNSFTPNYDEVNDYFFPVFSPYGLDPKVFEMEIFDRWGHSVFKTTDINVAWDGTMNNKGDEFIQEGVYVYKIKYKDMEGKIYHKTGHVTLLK